MNVTAKVLFVETTTKAFRAFWWIAGGLLLLVALVVSLVVLDRIGFRPPEMTARRVRAEDVAGAYSYSLGNGSETVKLSILSDGTFAQEVIFKHGQQPLAVKGRWQFVNKTAVVGLDSAWQGRSLPESAHASLPAAELGVQAPVSWVVVDSAGHKGGFALFGSGSDAPADAGGMLLERR